MAMSTFNIYTYIWILFNLIFVYDVSFEVLNSLTMTKWLHFKNLFIQTNVE